MHDEETLYENSRKGKANRRQKEGFWRGCVSEGLLGSWRPLLVNIAASEHKCTTCLSFFSLLSCECCVFDDVRCRLHSGQENDLDSRPVLS